MTAERSREHDLQCEWEHADTGEAIRRQGGPCLRQDPQTSLLQGLRVLPPPFGHVTRPLVHQDTPAFEQIRMA